MAGSVTEEPEGTEHIFALPHGALLYEYEIRTVLGYGGFGITYLAFDRLLNGTVAIKEYLPSYLAARFSNNTVAARSDADKEAFREGVDAFLNEARMIARVHHQNVTQVRRFFAMNGTGYIVLNYEDGLPLSKLIERGPIAPAELRKILLGCLSALETVHAAGILHRDIKPSNIIVRADGSPVLIDFGAAREFQNRQNPMTMIMSPGYAPPEQYGEGGIQGPWTDFYALGASIYHCVAGERPEDSLRRQRSARFHKDPLTPAEEAGAGRFDPILLKAIDWMLRLPEEERPQTATEVLKAIEAGSDLPDAQQLKKHNKRKWIGVAAAALLIAIGLGFVAYVRATEPDADALAGAGYDRGRIEAIDKACHRYCVGSFCIASCPDSLNEAIRAKLHLLDAEKAQYEAAANSIGKLRIYIRTCRACEFKHAAELRISELYAKDLDAAGFDRGRLTHFLLVCGSGCSDDLANEARHRLQLLDKEAAQYNAAGDDIEKLIAYSQKCQACEFKAAADARIKALLATRLPSTLLSQPAEATQCDRLAAHPSDPDRPPNVPGVAFVQIDAAHAIEACRAALLAHPNNRRLMFELGRALDAAQQFDEATRFYLKAAYAGDAAALYNLGTMYAAGHGVPKDDDEALRLYREAANAGSTVAMYSLGEIYASGRGVTRDLSTARGWYRKAADLGDERARIALTRLH